MLGQRERGWREVGRKEVRKVEEMRGVEGGGGGEEGLEGGCGEGFGWWVWKVDRILRKRRVETRRMLD